MLGLQVASSPSPDVATGRSTRALWFMQGGALAALLLMAVAARDAAAKPAVDSAAPPAKPSVDSAAPLAKPSVDSAAPLAKPSVDSAAPPTQPAHNLAGAVALYNEGPLFAPSLPVAQPVSAERAQWAISARKQRQQVSAPSMTQAHTVAAAAEQVSRRAALAAAAGVAASAVAATQPASAATPEKSVAPVLKEKLLVVYGADGTMNPADVNKIAREKLTDAQKKISLLAEDEEPFTGQTTNGYTWENKEQGTYVGAISGTPLFESDAQFDFGNGLPSFSKAFAGSVIERLDPQDLYQQRMAKRTGAENVLTGKFFRKQVRTEVIDATSGAHLGYVFDSDIRHPTKTRKWYSINAGALTFVPAKTDAVVV